MKQELKKSKVPKTLPIPALDYSDKTPDDNLIFKKRFSVMVLGFFSIVIPCF